MKSVLKVIAFVSAVTFAATAPAQGAIIRLYANMTGSQENPPTGSAGIGTVNFLYDNVAQTLNVHEVFSGLGFPVSDNHIHCCQPVGANGPVAIPFGATPDFADIVGDMAGTYDNVFDLTLLATFGAQIRTQACGAGCTDVDAIRSFFVGKMLSGLTYINLHTGSNGPPVVGFPGGEIRGQIFVPEPASIAVFGISLLGLGFARRKAKKA